ncbi:MAG: hypothetical protein AB9836_12130 [Aminipila sp.]
MKTVLVITSSHDILVDYIIAIYSQKCIFFRLDLDRMCDYNLQLNEYGWSIDNYREFVTDKTIDAIYYRKPIFPNFRKYDGYCQDLMKKDIEILIRGIANAFEGKCLSRPHIIECAENKVYQMYLAKKIGFSMPESLITNSPRCMDRFCAGKKCTAKSLSVGNKPLGDLEVSPAYFQQDIVKDYEVIVNFICDKSYVVRVDIEHNKIKKGIVEKYIKYTHMRLPDIIEEKCLNYMKAVNLQFCSFDFIVKNGEYYFLEVNPNAQWLGLENELGWDLSAEIIDYLCS